MKAEQPVRTAGRLSASDVAAVLALADRAFEADGVYPLSEDVVLRVRDAASRENHASPADAPVKPAPQAPQSLQPCTMMRGPVP